MEKKENEGNRVELNRQQQQQQQIMYSRDSPFNSTCNPSMISMLLSLSLSLFVFQIRTPQVDEDAAAIF